MRLFDSAKETIDKWIKDKKELNDAEKKLKAAAKEIEKEEYLKEREKVLKRNAKVKAKARADPKKGGGGFMAAMGTVGDNAAKLSDAIVGPDPKQKKNDKEKSPSIGDLI